MKTLILHLSNRIKTGINRILDRIIDLCVFFLTWSEVFPDIIRDAINRITSFIGNLVLLTLYFPRIDAYSLKGKEWNIVFIGRQESSQEISTLFFEGQEVSTQVLPCVPVWKLPDKTKQWLANGEDLVICELSKLFPWKPSESYSFSVPEWVTLILDISANPEDLLVGGRIRGQRRCIRQAEKNGFSYRFTRSFDDFNFFYSEMYLPFISARHGEQASISRFTDQRDRWFKPGGLLLVTKNDQPVAGALVIRAGRSCYGIELGVLHNDPELVKAGVNAFILWSCILWGHSQGAKHINIGTSHAWCTNGSFNFKTKWGARVIRHKNITPQWIFTSGYLPDSLRERINQIEFISEQKGKYYCTYIPGDATEDLDKKVQEALLHGLSGLAVVHKGSTQCLTANLNPDQQD